eukprot:11679-Chlamydomonas_euryale.AAC.7
MFCALIRAVPCMIPVCRTWHLLPCTAHYFFAMPDLHEPHNDAARFHSTIPHDSSPHMLTPQSQKHTDETQRSHQRCVRAQAAVCAPVPVSSSHTWQRGPSELQPHLAARRAPAGQQPRACACALRAACRYPHLRHTPRAHG